MTSKEMLENILNSPITKSAKGCFIEIEKLKEIKQDLDRLYELEQTNNILRAFVGNLQTCREREARKIEELEKKNQVLREKVNHFKNVKNRTRRNCKFYEKENDKLKQLINKIKSLPNCDICDANWHKGCMCLQNKLKEVLGND